MGIIKGTKRINEYEEQQARLRAEREARMNAPKVEWFKLEKSGESVRVRFLQELDPDSANYSEKHDLGFIATEHSSPSDFKRKALCSMDDEGRCWACEQHREDPKAGWRISPRLYINAVTNPGTENEKVVVISQGTSGKSITPTLLEYSRETGSITDREWKITRNGTGTDTSWTIVAFDKKDFAKGVDEYDSFPLEKSVVRNVPYEEQEGFYGGATVRRDAAPAEEPKDKATGFNTW